MKYKMIDYKGKYFILQDKVHDECYDFEIGEMEDEEITDEFLHQHVLDCIYYGIPAYIGENKELAAKIDALYKKYEENY